MYGKFDMFWYVKSPPPRQVHAGIANWLHIRMTTSGNMALKFYYSIIRHRPASLGAYKRLLPYGAYELLASLMVMTDSVTAS